MLFYHYSKSEYKELKSLYARGGEKKGYESDDNDPYGYKKNISLFLEPIPRDIAKILHGEHEFWKSGTALYEHVIDLSAIPKDIVYMVTDTRLIVDLLYNKQDWSKVEGNPKLREQYLKEAKELEDREGYSGEGRDNLVKVIKGLKYDIKKDYKEMYKLHKKNPEDNLMKKYAACVTHLMIYPASTPIKVSSSFQITLE